MTRVAPYGTWRSPISAEMVSAEGVALSQPWLEDGSVYWRDGWWPGATSTARVS